MMQQPPSVGPSASLMELYDLPLDAIKKSRQFRDVLATNPSKEQLLASIPSSPKPSYHPIYVLYTLLTEIPGQWPVFDLVQCHSRLVKLLPEEAKAQEDGQHRWFIEATSQLIKQSYISFFQFISQDDRPALRATNADSHITHRALHNFVSNFHLPVQKSKSKNAVVAIALPNGPMLAATCIAVTSYYTAAPINPAAGPEQFRADVTQAGAACILTTRDDYERLQLGAPWVQKQDLQVFIVDWDGHNNLSVEPIMRGTNLRSTAKTPNKADDIGLILFTSGTSGTKKVVPLTLHSIVAGIVFVINSWGLSEQDICLNMMPLYHVGGLVRNIFAPIFSGGSTVCCPTFDPNLFWDVVEEIRPTWYYASPSMHSVILAESTNRSQALKNSRIRLACNAAGGLLPSLAYQLRDTFDCVVLPSYGMTECMPISTPPLNYKLDREGTSGISTGPEITILDWSECTVTSGTVGRICVRGEPVFPGYLKPDGTYDKSPFNQNGWFDTGDLGFMDDDGYLYITGRSKEVINRGGELISPFEVENAVMSASLADESPISGRVSQVLAFSAFHDVLQEVVGVCLVTPPGKPRVDLRALHEALRSSLQQVKWPVLIIYMDDLPKKNNKILRIKLAKRLDLPEVTDDTPYLDRHWLAICPPPDTSLDVPIHASRCLVDYQDLDSKIADLTPTYIEAFSRKDSVGGGVETFLAPRKGSETSVDGELLPGIKKQLGLSVDNFMVPSRVHAMPGPLPTTQSGNVDEAVLQEVLDDMLSKSYENLGETTEGRITKIFADILAKPPGDIPRDIDFLSLGGDSLRAGRLMSSLRAEFNVHLPISLVFSDGSVAALAAAVEKLLEDDAGKDVVDNVAGCTQTRSSTNPILMLVQLIPLAIIYPLRRAVQWTIFIVALAYSQKLPTNQSVAGRLVNLIVSITIGRVAMRIIAPLFGIICKWLIIGRYREGIYPMWGLYHTRWWMVQKIVSICGKGMFSMTDGSKRLYCRLMGAKIGKNVKLAGAALGEWDLIDIGDNTVFTRCVCRPFAAEGNTSMYLGRIMVGENCSVGISSILAPGTKLPANTCIGLNSSSWEMEDADESYRTLSPGQGAKPHWLLQILLTIPLRLLAWALSLLPWIAGLIGMVLGQPRDYHHSPLRDILDWFTHAERVAYHYLALVLRCVISPFILFGFAVLVKLVLDVFFGQLATEGPGVSAGTIATWRASLIKTLLPVSSLHEVTTMFGQHYEATSVALRMLGSKVGKRVYWPGTGPSISDYHLLQVGDDVVFGSRSHIISTDGTGSQKVTIGDRAMIADRVALLPGVQIGKGTTMGSGALTQRGRRYSPGGTYVGSKEGDAVCLSTGSQVSKLSEKTHLKTSKTSSHDTLRGFAMDEEQGRSNPSDPRLQHMSSDETLRHGQNSNKDRYVVSSEPLTSSESDSEDDGIDDSSKRSSPFGRAFYQKLAPYHVLGPFAIFCYSSFLGVFTSFYWNVPNISSIQLVDLLMGHYVSVDASTQKTLWVIFVLTFVGIAILTTLQAILAVAVVIAAKWMLLGRRQPGNYDWDKSPYCQRWQIFLNIEKLRRHCYRGNGVLGMLTGTSWIVWYFRALGAKIGKDCALFANGSPSLMFTEPDLITLGDRVVVDDASVVGHINTRGKFDLNRLEIGDRCVLRTGSRLLSGATMKNDSCLLEHTLIMGGDIVEERWTMQGWPAERFLGKRV